MSDEISGTRCKAGDLAYVLRTATSDGEPNIGLIVTVESKIGFMQAGEIFTIRDIQTKAPVTDTYWWITHPRGLHTPYGPTSRCMSPDKWLRPIPPDLLDDDEETGESIYKEIEKPELIDG